MKKSTFPSMLACLAVYAGSGFMAQAQTAQDILQKFDEMNKKVEAEKAAALKDYVEKNGKAIDYPQAVSALVTTYMTLGKAAEALPYLEKSYAATSLGNDTNLQEFIPEILMPLFEGYKVAGNKEKARDLIKNFGKSMEKHPDAEKLIPYLASLDSKLNAPGVGDTLEISFTSLQGEKVDLAALKGKVVLIDFWATWCGPCVQELPNVQKTYAEWHDKGLEIIAISLDQEKEALQKFITDKKMPWPQYFDGKGWETPMAQKYGISGIPAVFLVGKDGKIVATELRGPELTAKVAELLK